MTTLCLATDTGPVIVTQHDTRWRTERALDVSTTLCIAPDSEQPQRVLCGTTARGAWRSDDAGATWHRVFAGLPHEQITSLAVSTTERAGEFGVIYAGTEPSAVFRSEDGGETWRPCSELTDLPSSRDWSFPPRPETHHVRWIQPDPHGGLFVAIEAGALIHSPDGGQTWQDRVAGGPRDTHQLAIHPNAPGRLWSAAGDGFFESRDSGASWRKSEEGLRFRYCWSVAVDPADPETVVLSAAPGPRQAHTVERAEFAIYRRRGNAPWEEVRAGLPDPKSTRVPVLATNPAEPGMFYVAADDGLCRSADGGVTWQRLDVDWPQTRRVRVHALAVVAAC
jgi:photosystem II stability/assembly factor-like uncharacterized protein